MNIRKITSMTLFLSGIVLLFNSIVLYVVPEGRVSNWADWKYLALNKGDWAAQHITIGVLFSVCGILHIYYNWKPIVTYMKNKAKEIKVFTGSFNIALILTFFFIVGTYLNIPPMSTIINFSESFKIAAATKYGEPPYGHAESSSLKMFTNREGLDLSKSIELLKAQGIITDGKELLKDIAHQAGKSPQEIYLIIQPATLKISSGTSEPGTAESFLQPPKSGMGKKKFVDLCHEFNLDVADMVTQLEAKGLKVNPENSMKEIAEANDSGPMQVYEAMREVVEENMKK